MESPQQTPTMQYRYLGNTGLLVSELCLGAMTFATSAVNHWGMPTSDEATSHAILDRFAAAGGNFIDTSDMYGESEEVLGRWLAKQKRSDFIIATKARGAVGKGPNDVGLSRHHILNAIEDSLKRLGTDYIDLYQCHFWDADTPLRETLTALNDLVRSGKVRYVGISNFLGWQLQKAVDLCNQLNFAPLVSLQPQYNLLCRWTEWELLPICINEGLAVLPWSPLKGGWLAGKFKRPTEQASLQEGGAAGSRIEWAQNVGWDQTDWRTLNTDHTWNVIDAVKEIAANRGKTAAQVSLRWLLQKPGVTSPIIGARTLAHLEDNLGVLGWQLTDEEMKRLDDVSAIEKPYPWGMHWTQSRNLNLKLPQQK